MWGETGESRERMVDECEEREKRMWGEKCKSGDRDRGEFRDIGGVEVRGGE